MLNETLDIDGNMWCIMPSDGCLGDPATPVSFGRTIREVVAGYRRELRASVTANLPADLEPESRDGFVGISCKEPNIDFVGYNHHKHVLRVEYANGNCYNYFDVPDSIWQKLLVADCKGAALVQMIKGNYRFCRVEGEE